MKSMQMGWCGDASRFEMSITRLDEDMPDGIGMTTRQDVGTHIAEAQCRAQQWLGAREAEGFVVYQNPGTVFVWHAEKSLPTHEVVHIVVALHVGDNTDQLGGRKGGIRGTVAE